MYSKFDSLKKYLYELNEQGICLAFSGGIDSTLLLFLCKDLNITAVTFKSVFQTDEEIKLTEELCNKYRVKQLVKEFHPLETTVLKNNPKDRCYHCKKLFFKELKKLAGSKYVLDGTNFDDLSAYRPGLKALKELEILSPLAMFHITKQEIRNYAEELGLEIFDKPSTPCLATRFPYGTQLTKEKFYTVANGEKILKNLGFNKNRMRIHDNIARIEIPETDFENFLQHKNIIINKLKELGLKYLTLDIEGLRSGSMDE